MKDLEDRTKQFAQWMFGSRYLVVFFAVVGSSLVIKFLPKGKGPLIFSQRSFLTFLGSLVFLA